MRIALDDGTRVFFDVAGEGIVATDDEMHPRPTLLLLHGGPGSDHSSFKPDFSALADVAQVIFLDHRGQGRSDRRTPDEWQLDIWADDVHQFCEALEIERPIVCGLSFGGLVAQHYGARYPDHPAGLILMSTLARFHDEAAVEVFRRLGGDEAADAAHVLLLGDPTDEDREHYRKVCGPFYTQTPGNIFEANRVIFNHDVTTHFFKTKASLDLRPELPSITAPCMVLVGEDDPITPVVVSDEIVAGLTNTTVDYRVFDHCGHGVTRDQPEAAFAAIRAFIAAHGSCVDPASPGRTNPDS